MQNNLQDVFLHLSFLCLSAPPETQPLGEALRPFECFCLLPCGTQGSDFAFCSA